MAKYLSDEYFAQVQTALKQDPKWVEISKNFKSSIAINATDIGQYYVITVDNGVTTVQKSAPGASTEFSLDGTYDAWCKVGKGEVDTQSAVLKGQLKFKGSITKILYYRDRFLRIAEVMRGMPVEF